jgi:hypothetical protein
VEGEVNVVYATTWSAMTGQAKVVSGGKVVVGKTMAGFETRWTTGVVDPPGTSRGYLHFFAVQIGPRVRRVLYVADDKAQFDEHLPAVKAMLDSVGVDPAVAKQRRAAAAAADGENTGFEGMFYRSAIGFVPGGERGQVDHERVDYLCFAPNGLAYNGHPTGGPVACLERDVPQSPSYGRYTLSGDEIVIKWNHDPILNRQHTQKLRRLPDGKLRQGDDAEFHRFAACDGLKLDGTYSRTWADGSKTRVRFTKDGRFTEQGLRFCLHLDDLVHPDWPEVPRAGGGGTYSIGRNTLEVKYDNDGPSRRMLFTTPDDPSKPNLRRITIAGKPMEREP